MLFSSITFLFYFLPAVLIVYFAAPGKWKNYVLLLSSLFFYFCGEPVYTLLLVFSSISDYLHSLLIEKHRGTPAARRILISSIVINLAMLGFFKYADFIITNINALFQTSIPALGLTLPIGISFFTFQTMSYTIDVYRGEAKAERNFFSLATYVCLFPQLVAGPIVRYTTIAEELNHRKHSWENTGYGIRRFTIGLAKKVLIANALGELTEIFRVSDEKSVLFYWMYAIAFTLHIYFDFSGYSDMAIGLGRIFGFHFLENFDYPYISKSITEFWRRWHMSLSTWFRDYVYIPLGGNRTTTVKWIRNILVVWFLTGFWHGAAWNFMFWGLLFGVLLIVEKLWLRKLLEKLPSALLHVYVLFFVIISFVLFNAADMGEAASYIAAMFGGGEIPFCNSVTLYYLQSYAVLFVIAVIGATPFCKRAAQGLTATKAGGIAAAVLEPVLIAALILFITAYLVDGSFNPFLYFRF